MFNGKKILFIGNGGVGKTEIIRNLIGHNFRMPYTPTSGLVYYQNDTHMFIDRSGQEMPFLISNDEMNQLNDVDEIILCYPSDQYSTLFLNVWFTYISRLNKPYKIFVTKSDISVPNSVAHRRDKFLNRLGVEKIFVTAKRPNLGL
jgi:ethanolamine utilization protein EutP (predicted NTPase)